MSNAGHDNLIPMDQRSEDEAREMGRQGGVASGEARRRKKHGKELLRSLLEMKEKDPRLLKTAEAAGIPVDDATLEVIMHLRQIEKAKLKADTEAYKAVMKTAGYDLEGVIPETVTIKVATEEEAEKLKSLDKLGV